jgi:hypothetical protein
VTEPRGAEDRPERYPALAAELVRLQVEVIVAPGPPLPRLSRLLRRSPLSWRAPSTPWASGSFRASGAQAGTLRA